MVHEVTISAEIGRIENEYFPNATRGAETLQDGGRETSVTRQTAAEFLRGFKLPTPKVLDPICRGSEQKHGRATGMP
jgi:hypothetical protein